MTILAVSILAENEDGFLHQLKLAQAAGAEGVEVRMDGFAEAGQELVFRLVTAVKKTGLPVIVTCRDTTEGGLRDIEFSHRLGLLKKAIECHADYVDVEIRSFRHPDVHSVINAALEVSPTKLILSAHNFEGPFDDLRVLYESILSVYPDAIPKIVFKAGHLNDCFTAFDLLLTAEIAPIAFCMGSAGQASRVLAKKLGAPITYACMDDAARTAPGQITLRAMKESYRWDAVNSETEIFGVIGNPIAHSLSPALFNACFEKDQINALYLPFLLEGEQIDFSLFLDQVRRFGKIGFGGFSVTIPHKTNALNYAVQHGDYIDPLAVTIGSVNTLKIGFNGIVSAYNTDYVGALDALAQVTGNEKHYLHQTAVAVIGAGGAARAVIAGLINAGAKVTIYNRTVGRAEALAREFGCRAERLDAVVAADADILINCTSVGMYPKTNASPVPQEAVRSNMVVFDTVYNPLDTELLRKAREVGATTVSGAEMFIRQAAAQYKIFVGREPDRQLMRQFVYDKLRAAERA